MISKSDITVKNLISEMETLREDPPKLLDKAMELYDLANEDGNQDLKDLASCLLGDACVVNKDFSYAIHLLTDGIKGLKYQKEELLLCRCLNEIGVILHGKGHFISAQESFTECIRVARLNNFDRFEAMACSNFAGLCVEMTDYEDALKYYKRAIECFTRIGNPEMKGNLIVCGLSYICRVYILMDNELKASATYHEMETYIDNYNVQYDARTIVLCRLLYRHYIEDKNEELKLYETMKEEYYRTENYGLYHDECINLFQYMFDTGRYEELEEAINHYHSLAVCEDMANEFICTEELLMKMYEKKGDIQKASAAALNYTKYVTQKNEDLKRSFIEIVSLQKEIDDQRKAGILELALDDVDELTGLPGKKRLNVVVDEMFERAKREGKAFAVHFIDIDDFKDVNDSMGHEVGDNILITAASLMKTIIDEDLFISRYDDDLFIILYYDTSDAQILDYAKKIHDKTAEIGRENLAGKLSVSQGIVNAVPVKENRTWDYLSLADEAVLQVKREIKGDCLFVHHIKEMQEPVKRIF